MLAGQIILEDQTISFANNADGMMDYTITEYYPGKGKMITESFTVPIAKFMKALSISVHNEGMPDYREDYQDAESIMGVIRWIP